MLTQFDWVAVFTTSPWMLILLGCSVLTLGVVVERLHYYNKRRGNPEETLATALAKVRSGEFKEAGWACRNAAHPMGAVAAQVLEHRHLSQLEIEEKMQIALSEQKLLLERNLGFLGTMAGAAPLIGLLGTVWGIMRAFHNMAVTGSSAPAVVAAGVAEALITTAAGLIVAVPALMLYNHFARQMNVMLTVAENNGRSLRAALATCSGHKGDAPQASMEMKRSNPAPAPASVGS